MRPAATALALLVCLVAGLALEFGATAASNESTVLASRSAAVSGAAASQGAARVRVTPLHRALQLAVLAAQVSPHEMHGATTELLPIANVRSHQQRLAVLATLRI